MKRRDFLSSGLTTLGAVSVGGRPLEGAPSRQNPTILDEIARERAGHPLYFDGMTFFDRTNDDVRRAGLSGLLWDVSVAQTVGKRYVRQLNLSLKSIAAANAFLRRNDKGLFLATRGSQIVEAARSGRTAIFLQFQSAESISDDVDMLDVAYELGLRVLQFTHHHSNAYSGGGLVKEWTGLTRLGFKILEKMNALGIIPDISHGNEIMALDTAKASRKPVIISHTGCRALVNSARCVPDSVIKAVAETGGVVGIFSMSFWLTEDPVPTVEAYIRQLEHVVKVGGINAVGVANDYDLAGEPNALKHNNNNDEAVKAYFPWWKDQAGILGFDKLPRHCVIPELNNIRRFFTIQTALEKKGHSAADVEKIMGRNWVRVYTESLG
jgi:membrane dipeptidase